MVNKRKNINVNLTNTIFYLIMHNMFRPHDQNQAHHHKNIQMEVE